MEARLGLARVALVALAGVYSIAVMSACPVSVSGDGAESAAHAEHGTSAPDPDRPGLSISALCHCGCGRVSSGAPIGPLPPALISKLDSLPAPQASQARWVLDNPVTSSAPSPPVPVPIVS